VRLVIQRVSRARVAVNGETMAAIGPGLLVLCGVARGDTRADAAYLARKTRQLRIFNDQEGRLNEDLSAAGGSILVVSQFTLYGDCAKGNRPSYIDAAPPEEGLAGYEAYVGELRALGCKVETGVFREHMAVELENDGPVTLLLESRGRSSNTGS
jgi:D-aminoacyl-tRNA deacylase